MKKLITFVFVCLTTIGGGFQSCSDYDDSALWKDIEDIKSRLDELNGQISSLRQLIEASQTGKLVVNVVDTGDGYKLIFSDGSDITLYHGKNGTDAPAIGVRQDTDGIYYWTVTISGKTEWLLDEGKNKIPVSGHTGHSPQISVDEEGYWLVDGQRISDGNGGHIQATGRDGDSFLQSVEETDTEVIITLVNGTVITLQKFTEVIFTFGCENLTLPYGRTVQVDITQSGVKYTSVSKPDGWKVQLCEQYMIVTSPARPNRYAEQSGVVSVVAVGSTSTVVATIVVEANPNISGGGAGDSNWQDW